MANFIAYGTRLNSRKIPTLNVVGTFASGGYDLLNLKGNGASMQFYELDGTHGLYGSAAADFVGGHTGTAKAGFTAYGEFEVVGVQVSAVGYIKPSGAVAAIQGEGLANYVEKTEHRYLQNGHIHIKVYINEQYGSELGGNGDGFVIAANVLLQSGSSVLGTVTKKSVPMVLNMPHSTKGTDANYQNPTVDLDAFIYGSDSTGNFGTEVRVLDMGLDSAVPSVTWNTVRSQAWNFGQFSPSTTLESGVAGEVLNDDSRFFPMYGQAYTASDGKLDFAARRMDTSRSRSDLFTAGSAEKLDPQVGNITNEFNADVNLHTGSGSSFDLREMHQMGGQSIQVSGGITKETFGRFIGPGVIGPEGDHTRYIGGGSAGGGYPIAGTGKLAGHSMNHSEGIGFPNMVNGNEGGKAHFFLDGSRRNPFYPHRADDYTPQDKSKTSAYSHYINFHKIEGLGTDLNGNEVLPTDLTSYPITDASLFPAYIANGVRLGIRTIFQITDSELQSIHGQSAANTKWFAPASTLASPMAAVVAGSLSWQDYVASLLRCNSYPLTNNNLGALGLTTDSGIDQFDVRFSGSYQTTKKISQALATATSQGISLATPDGTPNEFEEQGPVGNNLDDLRTSRLFTYQVFMYSDNPSPRINPVDLDEPLGQITENPGLNALIGVTQESGVVDSISYQTTVLKNGAEQFRRYHINWGSSDIADNKCIDRNASTAATQAYEDDSFTGVLANSNECTEESYLRCGCKSIVEEYAINELSDFANLEASGRRFETVITYPRPVSTNQNSIISASNSYSSIYYINSYFSAIDTTTAIQLGYSGAFLENNTPSNITFDTSDGATFTNSLNSLGLDNYGTLPFITDFVDLGNNNNTFKYLYYPGREHYEDEGASAFFTHNDVAEARVFVTTGIATGSSSTPTPFDDLEHRQMLLFEAGSGQTAGSDIRRAHYDVTFETVWEDDPNVEASYLSLGTNEDCATGADDNPRFRIRKFVNVSPKAWDETVDGDPNDGDGNDDENAVLGCTDVTAINFNPAATQDDGSCINCDGTLAEDAEFALTNVDPFHYIPLFFLGINDNNGIKGTAPATSGTTTTGDLYDNLNDVNFTEGDGPSTYDWWSGNAFNAFNTRGPGTDLTFGALNTPSSQYAASPISNTANSKFTYFRATVPSPLTSAQVAQAGLIQQFGSTSTEVETAVAALLDTIGQEDASSISARIYRYSDWETYVQTGNSATIPNEDQGNTGWYLDNYSTGAGPVYANVYSDTVGDFSGVNLDDDGTSNTATVISSLSNQSTGQFSFKFDFRNYTNFAISGPEDIGLEAGEQYVIVYRFYPKNACSNTTRFYYWASNFFVEYCQCTRPTATNAGISNPIGLDNALYPHVGANWDGVSYFPGVNTPYDVISSFAELDNTPAPSNFCSLAAEANEGLSNIKLCADPTPDATTDCEGFASWCLSDIRPQCKYDENGMPFGTLSMTVLIDGFFTQSDLDTWSLQPFQNNAQNTLVFYWQIQVALNGVTEQTISSHVFNSSALGWEQNPAVQFTQATEANDFYGQIASIEFTDLEWDDTPNDNNVDDLQMTVSLTFLGVIELGGGAGTYVPGYPDYVLDSAGEPVSDCGAYDITYNADFSDCAGVTQGCTDPLAINYDETATADDGSCEYTDCTELFDSFRNSIFITDVTTGNDTLNCAVVEEDGGSVNIYTPAYTGTMSIVIQDFSDGVLGITGDNIANFTIAVARMQAGAVSILPTLLNFYDQNVETIQTLEPGVAFGVTGVAGLNAAFIAPGPTSAAVTSVAGQVDPVGTNGVQFTTTVPINSIFSSGGGNLAAGQYLVFVIPNITIDENDDSGIADCDNVFLSFADEVTIAFVDNTIADADCPEPCNQFTNPADCPNAVPGCTDSTAGNYDELATIDDGSCEYCIDCDPCDLYPLDPDCIECDKGEEPDIATRVKGFGARIRDCDGETETCCTDPTAQNYDANCELANDSYCEYGTDDEECDENVEDCDPEPICPDPTNPACEGEPTGNCIDDGDCPCVGTQCNEDCIFDENDCEPVDGDDDEEITETFSTTTVICLPSDDVPIPSITINGEAPDNIAQAAAVCDVDKGDKMLMRMKAGVEYDTTDLLKLSLINYLFTSAAKQQLDCIFDCDNYETKAKSGGKARSFTTRLRGAVDCAKNWKSGKYQYFAGSSSYKKGVTVRYIRVVNGTRVASYFTAKRDWRPGMDVPGSTINKELRSWEPCNNLKYQEGTNPENYYQTFWEFISRYCGSCEVITNDEGSALPPKANLGVSRGTAFLDEFGNEIIF